MAPRVVVDAANVVAGGGVQVAASFVDQLSEMQESTEAVRRHPWLHDLQVALSASIAANLTRPPRAGTAFVEDRPRPWRPRRVGDVVDVVFEVFGPVYRAVPARHRITGFADGTSLWPEATHARGLKALLKQRVRRGLSRHCFQKADRLVVESPHAARALEATWGWPADRISVVPNVPHSVFSHENQVDRLPQIPTHLPTFCYVTRPFPHKNLNVLGEAATELRSRGEWEVRWVLTLTEAEFSALDEATRASAVNVGPRPINEVPAVYASCTGTIFTSLLECFSVTPLEAMASGSSLIASNRDFVREIAGEAAFYVDPTSGASIADAIQEVLEDEDERERRRAIGKRTMGEWPDARDRARAYVELIDDELRE